MNILKIYVTVWNAFGIKIAKVDSVDNLITLHFIDAVRITEMSFKDAIELYLSPLTLTTKVENKNNLLL